MEQICIPALYVLIPGAVIVFFLFIGVFLKRYVRCPANKILVIYGKVGPENGESGIKIIHGGAAFVWPIFQEYEFLDLVPIPLHLKSNIITADNEQGKSEMEITVGISTEPQAMQNAAERLLGLSQTDLKNICTDISLGQIRQVFGRYKKAEILSFQGHDNLLAALSESIETELRKIGFKVISLRINDVRFPEKFTYDS